MSEPRERSWGNAAMGVLLAAALGVAGWSLQAALSMRLELTTVTRDVAALTEQAKGLPSSRDVESLKLDMRELRSELVTVREKLAQLRPR